MSAVENAGRFQLDGRRPRVLFSNDDGYSARGLRSLVEALEPVADVWVVAPQSEQSAKSHALTIDRPLRVIEHAPQRFSVAGTPADCVYLGIRGLMKETPPDFVFSGINHGGNLSTDSFYSGTVAGAREGALLGIPSVAFSLVSRRCESFSEAAEFAVDLLGALCRLRSVNGLPPQTLLSANIPQRLAAKTFRWSVPGKHVYEPFVRRIEGPRDQLFYFLYGGGYEFAEEPLTDCHDVFVEHRVALVPLSVDPMARTPAPTLNLDMENFRATP